MNTSERRQYVQKLLADGRRAFRQELVKDSLASAKRLQAAYGGVKSAIDKRLKDVRILAESEGMTTRALANEAALIRLRDATQEALAGLSGDIEREARQLEVSGITAGRAVGVYTLQATLNFNFARPSAASIHALVNYVDSPAFRAKLDGYGEYHAQHVADIVLTGAADGKNPVSVARQVTNYLREMPAADAIRMTQTVQVWSARQAAHTVYRANENVVSGWIWSAVLDSRTCVSCYAMAGTIHPLDETLNDHYLGRCAPIPVTKTWAELGISGADELAAIPTGEQVFNGYTDVAQQGIMGLARWLAWRDGLFTFDQLSTTYEDDLYGTMRKAASLDQLIGRETANIYRRKAA